MKKFTIFYLIITFIGLTFIQLTVAAQEFPISISGDTTSSGDGDFDGANYLIGSVGDVGNPNCITAQLISSSGSLIGSRISLSNSGGSPLLAFDGTNYLVVWSNLSKSTVFGQFINTSGSLTGTQFVIADNATISPPKGGCIAFGGSTYMVVYKKNNINYGQCIDKSGNLVGSATQISENETGDNKMAFDGTNYLVTWWNKGNGSASEQDIYGQFISKTGELVGSNFIIDDSNYASDNPLSITFNGSKYMVTFHEQAAIGRSWNLYGRFISTSGIVESNRIIIRDSTYSPGFAFSAYDGSNYLITWADNIFSSKSVIKGQFFNKIGLPIDSVFTVFSSLNGKVPIYGGVIFKNNKYLVVTTRVDTINLTNGDIYGKFIQPLTAGLKENKNRNMLFNLYPNPASDIVTLNLNNGYDGILILNIYNAIGELVRSEKLVENQQKITIHDLNVGIYLFEIKSKEWTEKQKIIIQR